MISKITKNLHKKRRGLMTQHHDTLCRRIRIRCQFHATISNAQVKRTSRGTVWFVRNAVNALYRVAFDLFLTHCLCPLFATRVMNTASSVTLLVSFEVS